MWYKNPWLLLASISIAVILVLGTGVILNSTVVKTHNLEQVK